MQPRARHLELEFVRRGLFLAWTLICLTSARAEEPTIDQVELSPGGQVVFYFRTDADLTYELQAAESLSIAGQFSVSWTTLFVLSASPQSRQFIFVDRPTMRQRFYRLRINPVINPVDNSLKQLTAENPVKEVVL